MDNKIRVVIVEPGKLARIAYIEHELCDLQGIVGGLIETFFPFEDFDTCIICNDEGKLLGLPLNRAIRDEQTGDIIEIIAGTFFICDCSGEDFNSLDEARANYYCEMFKLPEMFGIVNGKLRAIKYTPED